MANFNEIYDTNTLYNIVNDYVESRGVKLNPNKSWGEDADRLENDYPDIADFLRVAEKRWYELEQ